MTSKKEDFPYRTLKGGGDFYLPTMTYRGEERVRADAPNPDCPTGTWHVEVTKINNLIGEFNISRRSNEFSKFNLGVSGGDTDWSWPPASQKELATDIEAVEKFAAEVIAYRDALRKAFDAFRHNLQFHPEYKVEDKLYLQENIGKYRTEDCE